MCFSPQRRALFQHLNCQKWSAPLVFCTFWLGNVLRATTACTFQHLNFQKWSEHQVVCTFLTWKCASRHNGVQFFISHLASWLRTRHFSEPTFRPSGAPNHGKNTVFRDFPTFSRICIFFLLTLLSSNLLSSDLSLLSASALLCFSSVHIVGSLTSKLPSNMFIDWDIIGMFNVRLVSWAMDTPPMRLIFPPTGTVFQLQSQFQKPTCTLMGKIMTNQWI